MKILVTGGTGFIGSHTIVELLNSGYEVEIVDNLVNSKASVIDKIEQITGKRPVFHKVDLLDETKLDQIFANNNFDLVIHFAGLKAVAESVEKPLLYYKNNLFGTINLLNSMLKHGAQKIIFSSSATVYGNQPVPKFVETMPTGQGITNPYGETKFMIEQILKDTAAAHPEFSVTILRYFNPVGAHPSGLIGEDPNGIPNNLMPIIMKVARGEIKELSIFGNDYDTKDGTCVRDFIHVVDLAKGHLAAIPKMSAGVQIYNLGSGHGTSVQEIIDAFERAAGRELPKKYAPRRAGDLPEMFADASKAERELGWETKLGIDDIMKDTLNYLDKASSHEL